MPFDVKIHNLLSFLFCLEGTLPFEYRVLQYRRTDLYQVVDTVSFDYRFVSCHQPVHGDRSLTGT